MLAAVGFDLIEEVDSTEASLEWFSSLAARVAEDGPPPVGFGVFLGGDFPQMATNQVANLAERRIRTVSYLCRT